MGNQVSSQSDQKNQENRENNARTEKIEPIRSKWPTNLKTGNGLF